jgi:hypothetical protein
MVANLWDQHLSQADPTLDSDLRPITWPGLKLDVPSFPNPGSGTTRTGLACRSNTSVVSSWYAIKASDASPACSRCDSYVDELFSCKVEALPAQYRMRFAMFSPQSDQAGFPKLPFPASLDPSEAAVRPRMGNTRA